MKFSATEIDTSLDRASVGRNCPD